MHYRSLSVSAPKSRVLNSGSGSPRGGAQWLSKVNRCFWFNQRSFDAPKQVMTRTGKKARCCLPPTGFMHIIGYNLGYSVLHNCFKNTRY